MHYVRFLKAAVAKRSPSAGSKSTAVRAVLTVTSDLADEFFPRDAQLEVRLVASSKTLVEQTFAWRVGMRAVPIELLYARSLPVCDVTMIVSPSAADAGCFGATRDGLLTTPAILSACSEVRREPDSEPEPARHVQRELVFASQRRITICEELGESIARHVWDAGIALAALVDQIRARRSTALPVLHGWLAATVQPNIIELGSGCGLVGVTLASVLPNSRVTATDLADAAGTIRKTFALNTPAKNSDIHFQVLDWESELPPSVRDDKFDLIVAADCTYNPDSSLALVRTISSLSRGCAEPLIVVALKTRHPSEAVFFEHMSAAGFAVREQTRALCPHWDAEEDDPGAEIVDIFVFAHVSRKS